MAHGNSSEDPITTAVSHDKRISTMSHSTPTSSRQPLPPNCLPTCTLPVSPPNIKVEPVPAFVEYTGANEKVVRATSPKISGNVTTTATGTILSASTTTAKSSFVRLLPLVPRVGLIAPVSTSSTVSSKQQGINTGTHSSTISKTSYVARGESISLARRAAANAKRRREEARFELERHGAADCDADQALLVSLIDSSAATRANVSQNKSKRSKRVKWSTEEVEALHEGVLKHGQGRWAVILRDYAHAFHPARISVDLKDKWRNILKLHSADNSKDHSQPPMDVEPNPRLPQVLKGPLFGSSQSRQNAAHEAAVAAVQLEPIARSCVKIQHRNRRSPQHCSQRSEQPFASTQKHWNKNHLQGARSPTSQQLPTLKNSNNNKDMPCSFGGANKVERRCVERCRNPTSSRTKEQRKQIGMNEPQQVVKRAQRVMQLESESQGDEEDVPLIQLGVAIRDRNRRHWSQPSILQSGDRNETCAPVPLRNNQHCSDTLLEDGADGYSISSRTEKEKSQDDIHEERVDLNVDARNKLGNRLPRAHFAGHSNESQERSRNETVGQYHERAVGGGLPENCPPLANREQERSEKNVHLSQLEDIEDSGSVEHVKDFEHTEHIRDIRHTKLTPHANQADHSERTSQIRDMEHANVEAVGCAHYKNLSESRKNIDDRNCDFGRRASTRAPDRRENSSTLQKSLIICTKCSLPKYEQIQNCCACNDMLDKEHSSSLYSISENANGGNHMIRYVRRCCEDDLTQSDRSPSDFQDPQDYISDERNDEISPIHMESIVHVRVGEGMSYQHDPLEHHGEVSSLLQDDNDRVNETNDEYTFDHQQRVQYVKGSNSNLDSIGEHMTDHGETNRGKFTGSIQADDYDRCDHDKSVERPNTHVDQIQEEKLSKLDRRSNSMIGSFGEHIEGVTQNIDCYDDEQMNTTGDGYDVEIDAINQNTSGKTLKLNLGIDATDDDASQEFDLQHSPTLEGARVLAHLEHAGAGILKRNSRFGKDDCKEKGNHGVIHNPTEDDRVMIRCQHNVIVTKEDNSPIEGCDEGRSSKIAVKNPHETSGEGAFDYGNNSLKVNDSAVRKVSDVEYMSQAEYEPHPHEIVECDGELVHVREVEYDKCYTENSSIRADEHPDSENELMDDGEDKLGYKDVGSHSKYESGHEGEWIMRASEEDDGKGSIRSISNSDGSLSLVENDSGTGRLWSRRSREYNKGKLLGRPTDCQR